MTEHQSATEKLLEENELRESESSVEMEDFFATTVSQYDEFDEAAWAKGSGFSCPNFPLFDKYMEGLESGLYMFAGESNSGKSAFLMNLMFDFCTHQDNNLFGIYFSLDDTKNEIIPRLISMRESIPISVGSKPSRYQEAMEEGREDSAAFSEYLEKRENGLAYLKSLNKQFKIEDSNKITCGEQILDYLKKLKIYLNTHAPEKKIIAAIDSISDITFVYPGFEKMTDKQKGDYIAKQVKTWAINLDIPILGSLHLRKIEQNRRPVISDVKESGRYVYEASALFLVHNDVGKNKQSATVYNPDESTGEKLPIIEIDWAKNKKSSYKGRTYHYFTPNFSSVTECSEEASKRFDALIYTN